MRNKLLFFDIDGTLIECGLGIYEIPQSTKASLQALQLQGHATFLATGRTKCFIVDGVMSYPFDGYVTCNGGYVEYQGKEIFRKTVSLEALQVTHEFCKEKDMVYYFEGRDTIYTLRKDHPVHIDFKEHWEMKDEVTTDDFDITNIETYIGMIVVNSLDQVADMKKTLAPYFDIQRHNSEYSFDLTLKGVSKGLGIEKLVEAMHKDIKDTIAFGDGNNDLEMLETVGIGVAMGNAVKGAKAVSDYVTDCVDHNGITKALQHFKLL